MYRASIVILLISFLIYFNGNAYNIEVSVRQGKLLGTRRQTVFDGKLYFAFYGVPYAQPPVNKLRFKDPKAPKSWEQPFDARTEYHGACAQAHIAHKHGLYGYEDCLHLNIYTPTLPRNGRKLKAVIVWIHGYAFTSSFSHIYGPDFLIDNDVIFVSVAHRIGPFGFLKMNNTDSNANMGLKDIVLALKWIRRNIKRFSGDKNNITVMGSGTGATFLALLLTTKHSKLFSKMILQSGALFSPSLFQGDHLLEKNKLEEKLKAKGYKNVETAPTKAIVDESRHIYTSKDLIHKQNSLIPFLPILEIPSNKSLITKYPMQYLETSSIKGKPILIGFNTQESISEVIPFLHNPHYLKAFGVHFKFMVPFATECKYHYTSRMYNKIANKIKKSYFKNGIFENSTDNFLRYVSDIKKYPIYHFIRNYLKTNGSRMYVYKFNYIGNMNAVKATSISGVKFKVRGAASGDEICYILKCEPIWENYIKANRDQNDRDRLFVKLITELWANFAKTNDPTPSTYKGNVTWPPTTLQDYNALHIGRSIHLVDTKPEMKMYTFWNQIYHKYYQKCSEHDEL